MNELVKVLYVEDDPDIQEVVRLSLELVGGLTLKVCSSGQEALDVGPAFEPQIILLDMMMPGMDGQTTFLEMRKVDGLKSQPVVFMTAKVQPAEVASYKRIGAFEVIAKPFDPMGLADRLRGIWERYNGKYPHGN